MDSRVIIYVCRLQIDKGENLEQLQQAGYVWFLLWIIPE
jgi:hypothetical protein